MLLWINGPFGIGKTATAHALHDAARNQGLRAWIYDPELFGMILQRIVPRSHRPADFREQHIWRLVTRAAVGAGARLAELLIVPMTIDDPPLLDFLTAGRTNRVVQLTAPHDVVEQRIRERDVALGWCLRHLERWPDDDALGTRIDAQPDPATVAEELLARFG